MAFTQISSDGIKDGTITGSHLATNIDLTDSQKIRFGNSQDLQLFHDGNNSVITAGGAGDLQLTSTFDDVIIQAADNIFIKPQGGEDGLKVYGDGNVKLYHANSQKFRTYAAGVEVTGNVLIPFDGSSTTNALRIGASQDLTIFHDGSSNRIIAANHDLIVQSNGYAIRSENGSSTFATIDSSGNIGIGTASPAYPIDVRKDSTTAYSASASPSNVIARIHNNSAQDNSHASFLLRASNDNAAADFWWISCVAQSQNYNGFLAFSARTTSSASQELVRFSNNGNVTVNSGQLQATGGFLTVDAASYKISNSSVGSSSTTYYIGNQAIQTSSDRRIKENIVNTEVDALSELKKVRVVDFNWNDPSDTAVTNRNSRGKWTGCIAQEIVDVFPFAVNAPRTEDNKIDNNSETLWGMEYEQLVPVLIRAIQDLNAKVEVLEAG